MDLSANHNINGLDLLRSSARLLFTTSASRVSCSSWVCAASAGSRLDYACGVKTVHRAT